MGIFFKKEVESLLKKHQISPSKKLGQNFLIDRTAINKFIEAIDPGKEDLILEIGPGLGILTKELAKKAKRVLAVEKDERIINILKENLREFDNVEIVQGDILKTEGGKIENYKAIGNLPFYLTAPIIRHFLERVEIRPKQMVFGVQKEVGQRICAKPPKMNILAVSVQFYSLPKIVSYIPKRSFWPKPKVDAAIISLVPKPANPENKDLFFKIVKSGFLQPRKQLLNNLSKGLGISKKETEDWLLKNGISPKQRAETLRVEDWINLEKNLKIEQ